MGNPTFAPASAALMLAVACTPTRPPRPRTDEPPSLASVPPPPPVCAALPQRLPEDATVAVSVRDGETATLVLDVAFVTSAACPWSPVQPATDCVRLEYDAMQALWDALVERALPTIEIKARGECIHCSGPWIAIAWPGGRCDVGVSPFTDAEGEHWQRLVSAADFLERVAALAGVSRRDPWAHVDASAATTAPEP